MLFEQLEPGARIHVLNFGPALPETVNFFARYHCRIHIVDLLREALPTVDPELEEGERLAAWRDYYRGTLDIPEAIRFDLLFFWDVLNFMAPESIAALMEVVCPHLHPQTQAHCFAVHNTDAPASAVFHGISDLGEFSVRSRASMPPHYQPLPQGKLASLLQCFSTDRSVLMRDQRTELLLKAAL